LVAGWVGAVGFFSVVWAFARMKGRVETALMCRTLLLVGLAMAVSVVMWEVAGGAAAR
jgi:hypothetical protein